VIASGAAALLLGLSLSFSVTAAAQTNPADTMLVLEQLVNGDVRCTSTGAVCSGVDLYGQDGNGGTLVHPGDQLTTTVQLRNASIIASAGLDLSPGACRNQTLSGGTADADLCATVTVAVACASPGGPTFVSGPQPLTGFGQDGARTVTPGLAAGASTMCEFTVIYPADAPPTTWGLRAVQPITWTLMAPDIAVAASDIERAPTAPAGGAAGGAAGGTLPVTGGAVLPLALAGLVLAVAGAVLSGRPRTLRTAVLVVLSRASRAVVRPRR
jgi:hypothetical protein